MNKSIYLLKIWRGVEGKLTKVAGTDVRGAVTKLIKKDGLEEEDTLLRLNISAKGIPTIECFSTAELEDLQGRGDEDNEGERTEE
jgi:hypothetical protein